MKRIQTRVTGDLSKYTENFFFGMSFRQTVFSLAGVAATACTYIFFLLPGILAIGCGMPFFALAFLKPDGLAAHMWLKNWVLANVLRPKIRENRPESDLYAFLFEGVLLGRRVIKEKETEKIRKEIEIEKEHEQTGKETQDTFAQANHRD